MARCGNVVEVTSSLPARKSGCVAMGAVSRPLCVHIFSKINIFTCDPVENIHMLAYAFVCMGESKQKSKVSQWILRRWWLQPKLLGEKLIERGNEILIFILYCRFRDASNCCKVSWNLRPIKTTPFKIWSLLNCVSKFTEVSNDKNEKLLRAEGTHFYFIPTKSVSELECGRLFTELIFSIQDEMVRSSRLVFGKGDAIGHFENSEPCGRIGKRNKKTCQR